MIFDNDRMMKYHVAVLIFALFLSAAVLRADDLYDGFKNPPASARPLVRWQWTICPTEQEITRQLDIIKNAGFGGVEIRPITVPAKDAKNKTSAWLTPEWGKMIKFAADAAKQRGMFVDLNIGSPLAASFIRPGERIQMITLGKKTLTGPTTFTGKISDLVKSPDEIRPVTADTNHQVLFLRLVPQDSNIFTMGDEFAGQVAPNGSVTIKVGEGKHTLYIGVLRDNFRTAGGDANILDCLNERAVEKYLSNISANLSVSLGGKLGDSIHAISCDNIDLAGANWTSDFAQQFLQRRGYDVVPSLPTILDYNFPRHKNHFYQTVRRTRYDFCLTFAELFNERFVRTFHKWCHDNGVASRFQATTNSWHLDMLNGSVSSDVVQGDTGVISGEWPDPNLDTESRCFVWNKIAASAVRLAGKSAVSSELTLPVAGFLETLGDIKQAGDLAFVSGADNFVLSGYNSSAANASFDDWMRAGAVFGDRNPCWPYFKNWTDRDARLSYLFQNSKRQARIAIVCPTEDLWSDYGLSKTKFVDYFWYLFPIWQALNHNGFTTDYVSDKVLSQMTYENTRMRIGSLEYDAVIFPDVFSVADYEPLRILRFYAQSGGRIIFIGEPPQTAAGFKDLLERSVPVQFTMDLIYEVNSPSVLFLPAPDKNKDNLTSWVSEFAGKINLQPTVKMSPSSDDVFFTHYLADNRDIFFFTNAGHTSAVSFRAQFNIAGKTPWVWNPETATRTIYPSGDANDLFDIELAPQESLLLVFEPNTPKGSMSPKRVVDFNDVFEIKSSWQAEFTHCAAGKKFSRKFDKLIDLGQSKDRELNAFAGTVVYRAEFDAPDTGRTALDLGKCYDISEVMLNGKPLGLRWYGAHLYDAADALKPGKNILEIKVTTSLANYARSVKDKRPSKPVPAGLAGPVRLLKTR